MRIFLFVFLFIVLGFDAQSQIRDSMIWIIKESPKVSASFKQTTSKMHAEMLKTAPRSYTFNDTLIFFTREFEAGILAGKAKGVVDANIIRTARKKYPGDSKKAVIQRLKMYSGDKK